MSQYRFTISTLNTSIQFGTENLSNWAEIETNLTRSKSYRGRVRKVTNSFEFVNWNGIKLRNIIMQIYADNGTNADMTLKIEIGDDNLDEFSFTDLGSGLPYKADFKSYTVTENGVSLNFLDSEFQELISAGEKEKLNITTDTTLTGEIPTDYTTLLKSIWCHDRTIDFNSKIFFNDTGFFLQPEYNHLGTFSSQENFAVRSIIDYKSDDNIKNTVIGFNIPEANPNADTIMYLISDKDRVLDIEINLIITSNIQADLTLSFWRYDVGLEFQEVVEIDTFNVPLFPTTVTKNILFNISVKEGDSLIFVADSNSFTYSDYKESFMKIHSTESFPATTANCILPHEFFTHWLELITGRKDGFYSDYFGRVDLGYAQDGEGAYLAIMDGYMLRNMPIDEYPLNAKFKDFVEDFIKLKNLVAGVEYVGDIEVFRIEKYTDTFITEVAADIGELVNDIELSVNEDLTFGSIKTGSKDIVLEDLNGLNSAHGEVIYSSPLNIDNELDLQIKAILNDYAIEQERRLQFSIAPEEDGKNDKKNFIIDSVKGGTTDVLAKTNQGFEIIEGILAPDKVYNLNLIPDIQLRLWGNVINGCLQKEQDKDLILTKSATNNTLVYQKTGEDETAVKDNIPVSDLDTPLFINETIIIGDAAENKELYDTIENNPNHLFKFTNKGVDFFTLIDKHNYRVSEKKGNFELTNSSR